MNSNLTLAAVVEASGGQLWQTPDSSEAATNPQSLSSSQNFSISSAVVVAPGTLTIENVVYDSREVIPGSLFVALPGETSDGHMFISQAVAKGAAACLVRRDWIEQQSELPQNVAWVVVSQTLPAFQRLGAYWRNQFPDLKVVGITGSVGKTSTKELLAAVLGQRFQVFKSPKSVNTEQSILPILFRLQPSDAVAVLEMGAGYQFGELERLCRVTRPQIGIELCVSHSHLGRMGTLDNIARNKAELVQSLPSAEQGGVAILNGDDWRVAAMAKLTPAKPFFFGTKLEFDLWADEIESFGLDGVGFVAHYQGQSRRLRSKSLGRHSLTNVLAAISVALLYGLSWEEIEAGLNEPSSQVRLVVSPAINGATVIDDSYNASPVSTVAALDLLAETPLDTGARRIAVLGDMLELGSFEEEGHRMVGQRVAQVADWLLVIGPLAEIIGQEALAQGFPAERLIFASTQEQIVDWLHAALQPGDYLLVKASRGMALEKIVEKVRAAS